MYINIDHTRLQLRHCRLLCASCLYTPTIPFACLTIMLVGYGRDACARATPLSTPVTRTDETVVKKPAQRSVGQTITVRLPSDPRPDISGASWAAQLHSRSLHPITQPIPKPMVEPEQEERRPCNSRPSLPEGETQARDARPWEKDVPSAKTFSVTLVVN